MTLFSRVSFVDKLLFTKHLSVMIKSGIIISEALYTLVAQTKSSLFKQVLSSVLADVEAGQSLSKSLAKFPRVFDQFYISLIEVGEESGTLEENLEFLAKQLAKDYSTRKKVQGAMLYPAIIFFAVAVMGGFISLFIMPQLVNFFAAFEIELPLPTKILLFFANLMKDFGLFIILGSVILVAAFILLLKSKPIKPVWHKITLRLPIFGQFIAHINLARFSRNLGTMLKSGVPLVRSLETTANTLDNLTFKDSLGFAQKDVSKGKQLAKTLENFQYSILLFTYNLYPPLVSKMIAVGEKTGKLEEVLLYLGDYFEEEIDNFSKNITTILEPILLIGIGLVVGFVALAIIGPIYELTGSLK